MFVNQGALITCRFIIDKDIKKETTFRRIEIKNNYLQRLEIKN